MPLCASVQACPGDRIPAAAHDDANLIKAVFDLRDSISSKLTSPSSTFARPAPADVVLVFGLLYHLENPIGSPAQGPEADQKNIAARDTDARTGLERAGREWLSFVAAGDAWLLRHA